MLREIGVLLELDLGLTEEGKLTKVESHGAGHCGSSTGPKSTHTFALCDAAESINDGLVVLSLGEGLEAVALHSNEGEISRVTDHGSNTTSGKTSSGSLLETNCSAFSLCSGGQVAHQCVEHAQAGGGVKELSAGDDLSSDSQGTGLGASGSSLASELDANLDHVDRLDDCGGYHAGNASVDEGEGGPHERCVKKVIGNSGRVASGL
ncbi:hypothetical protein HG531_005508 [Fusarium graminearum]|nr:hypothetical protein HG531_005508 [Fusarium graminearum]